MGPWTLAARGRGRGRADSTHVWATAARGSARPAVAPAQDVSARADPAPLIKLKLLPRTVKLLVRGKTPDRRFFAGGSAGGGIAVGAQINSGVLLGAHPAPADRRWRWGTPLADLGTQLASAMVSVNWLLYRS